MVSPALTATGVAAPSRRPAQLPTMISAMPCTVNRYGMPQLLPWELQATSVAPANTTVASIDPVDERARIAIALSVDAMSSCRPMS